MTKRQAFTQADLARAVRVADQLGKVALWTPSGIAFMQSDAVSLPVPTTLDADLIQWGSK